jgi:hypothetical protein
LLLTVFGAAAVTLAGVAGAWDFVLLGAAAAGEGSPCASPFASRGAGRAAALNAEEKPLAGEAPIGRSRDAAAESLARPAALAA